jgi:hypothetical protein
VKTTVTWTEEDMVFGSITPVMNLFDESKVRPDPLVEGRLLVVPCVAWRLLPLLSRHSLTKPADDVIVDASPASSQRARELPNDVGVHAAASARMLEKLTNAKVEKRHAATAMNRTIRDAPLIGRTVSRATLT